MRPSTQSLLVLSGLAGVLLTCQPVADARVPASAHADCPSPSATIPDAYLFYHALASHPGLYGSRARPGPCPAIKRIRT